MNKKLIVVMAVLIVLVLMACSLVPDINSIKSLLPTATQRAIVGNTPAPQIIVDPEDISAFDVILTNLYEQVNPGVVSIVARSNQGEGSGSGFVYDMDGHIITNYHVIEDATSLEVDFPSGFKVEGKVIGTDLDSDIAVIKVTAPSSELLPLPLGD